MATELKLCYVCQDDYPLSGLIELSCRQHFLCIAICLRASIHQAIKHEDQYPISCRQPCGGRVFAHIIDEQLSSGSETDRALLQLYTDKAFEYSIPHEFRTYCSSNACCASRGHSQFLSPHLGAATITCSECDTATCVDCKGTVDSRFEHSCRPDEYNETVVKFISGLPETERWLWRRCFQCRRWTEKSEACNHMTCECGAQYCLICGRPWTALTGCRFGCPSDGPPQYDAEGYNVSGFHRETGLNRAGERFNPDDIDGAVAEEDGLFDQWGFAFAGVDVDGPEGRRFDVDGWDRDGWNRHGFGRDQQHRITGTIWDEQGFNAAGRDAEARDRQGYDEMGFDDQGYNQEHIDREGYNREGWDAEGYGRDGFDIGGYDRDQLDRDGFSQFCLNPDGLSRRGYREEVFNDDNYLLVDPDGFDLVNGRDPAGFDDTGRDRHGLRKQRFDIDGIQVNGMDDHNMYTRFPVFNDHHRDVNGNIHPRFETAPDGNVRISALDPPSLNIADCAEHDFHRHRNGGTCVICGWHCEESIYSCSACAGDVCSTCLDPYGRKHGLMVRKDLDERYAFFSDESYGIASLFG